MRISDWSSDVCSSDLENGSIAAIALARYLGSLPVECRARDVQFALTSNHLGYSGDGTFRYGEQLDADFEEGTVAFVMALEHLGSREILPIEGAPDGELELTGEADLRSEERRVGKECVSTCRFRWSPYP